TVRAGRIVRPNIKRRATPRINVPTGNAGRSRPDYAGNQIDVNPGGGARDVDINRAAPNDNGLRRGRTSENDAGERRVRGKPRVDSVSNDQLACCRHEGGS